MNLTRLLRPFMFPTSSYDAESAARWPTSYAAKRSGTGVLSGAKSVSSRSTAPRYSKRQE
jgi:hypothetical protein